MFEDLFKGVEDRVETVSIAIDSDSLLFLSCYEYRDNWNIELAYMNFCVRTELVKREFYNKAIKVEDMKLCFTSSSNFRYDIYSEYKAHRKKEQSEDDKLLGERVKELKKTVYARLKPICIASNKVEADDLVISLSDEKGYWVASIDKDVITQSKTPVFNYGQKKWKFEHMGLTDEEINKNIMIQTIMGDASDGYNFIRGKGLVKATEFVEDILNPETDSNVNDYINLFKSTEECLLANRLVSMHQYKNGEVVLDDIDTIFGRCELF